MLRDRQHGQCMAAEGLFYSKPGGTADIFNVRPGLFSLGRAFCIITEVSQADV